MDGDTNMKSGVEVKMENVQKNFRTLHMIFIKFRGHMFVSVALIVSVILFTGIANAAEENNSNDSDSSIYFSKIYIDAFNVNSNGFKLL